MTPHTVVLMAALAALLCLPCALFRMMRAESVVRRAWLRRARLERPRLRRLDSGLAGRSHACDVPFLAAADGFLSGGLRECRCGQEVPAVGMPTFDQVMGELRRLDRERLGGPAQQSEEWARAVVSAYDRWLQVACTYLSVPHHLSCLTDAMDLEIERLRVEAELAAAGLPPIRRPDR
jgi:ribosome modulation factor